MRPTTSMITGVTGIYPETKTSEEPKRSDLTSKLWQGPSGINTYTNNGQEELEGRILITEHWNGQKLVVVEVLYKDALENDSWRRVGSSDDDYVKVLQSYILNRVHEQT